MKRSVLVALLAVSGSLRAVDERNVLIESRSGSVFAALGLQCLVEGMQAVAHVMNTDERVRASMREVREVFNAISEIAPVAVEQRERQETADPLDNNNSIEAQNLVAVLHGD
ncbi:MAG TPA: hypothetical protein VI521_01005 [Candidatus Babeliales bacterium]|nr:hypothetical protein [Candidatus Babeliales bacterium]